MFAAVVRQDGELFLRLIQFLALPLACIWFCDGIGRLTGIAIGLVRPTVTQTTPGDFLAIGGWLLLLSPIAALVITLNLA